MTQDAIEARAKEWLQTEIGDVSRYAVRALADLLDVVQSEALEQAAKECEDAMREFESLQTNSYTGHAFGVVAHRIRALAAKG